MVLFDGMARRMADAARVPVRCHKAIRQIARNALALFHVTSITRLPALAHLLTMTFKQAADYAAKLDAHGRYDWRLPNKAGISLKSFLTCTQYTILSNRMRHCLFCG